MGKKAKVASRLGKGKLQVESASENLADSLIQAFTVGSPVLNSVGPSSSGIDGMIEDVEVVVGGVIGGAGGKDIQSAQNLDSAKSADKVLDTLPQPGSSTSNASIPIPADAAPAQNTQDASAPSNGRNWSNLFAQNRAPSEGLKLEFSATPPKSCTLAVDDLYSVLDDWGPTLIGYVAGRFPGKKAIQNCCSSWPVPCKFSIHESGWLLFRFNSLEDLNKVLDCGPFFIFQRPLLLKVLPPFFNFENEELCHVPVWVRLHSLPFELWHGKSLGKILSAVGKPLRTDGLTASRGRASFARALVEVNAAIELVSEVSVTLPNGKTFIQHIDFEYVPAYCHKCKSLGHKDSACKHSQPSDAPAPSSGSAGQKTATPSPAVDTNLEQVACPASAVRPPLPATATATAEMADQSATVAAESPVLAVSTGLGLSAAHSVPDSALVSDHVATKAKLPASPQTGQQPPIDSAKIATAIASSSATKCAALPASDLSNLEESTELVLGLAAPNQRKKRGKAKIPPKDSSPVSGFTGSKFPKKKFIKIGGPHPPNAL